MTPEQVVAVVLVSGVAEQLGHVLEVVVAGQRPHRGSDAVLLTSVVRQRRGWVATDRAFGFVSAVAMLLRAMGSSMRGSHLTRI